MSTADDGARFAGAPTAGAPILDADPRRNHWVWELLDERRADMCDGLISVAEAWRAADVRHELEIAACVTDVWRRVDATLGEYLSVVWYVLLELRDLGPAGRCPTLERDLSPAAHPVVATALASARAVARADKAHLWDGGDPDVRQRLDEIRAALHRLALGELVPDLLAPPAVRPASMWWSPSAPTVDDASAPNQGPTDLRLLR